MSTYQVTKNGAAVTGALTYVEALQKENAFKRADVDNMASYAVDIFMPNRPVYTVDNVPANTEEEDTTMIRTEYDTTGAKLRSEYPTIETSVGTMAYWKSLQFSDYGRMTLGGFEPPYTGQPGSDKSITVNNVAYEGSMTVEVRRDGELCLEFSGMHRVGDWRSSVSDAAKRKLEADFLPLARELFPMPTRENIAAAIYRDAEREIYSSATSGIHQISSATYHDERRDGFSEDIRAGVLAGLERAKDAVARETFSVIKYGR